MLTIALVLFPVVLIVGALAMERYERAMTAPPAPARQADLRAGRLEATDVDVEPTPTSRWGHLRPVPALPTSR
jgi:hypothetical protein